MSHTIQRTYKCGEISVLKANTMIDWREVDVTATRLDNGDWYGKADLANLQSETEYRVKVASLNTEGYSPFSKIHTFTTTSAGNY